MSFLIFLVLDFMPCQMHSQFPLFLEGCSCSSGLPYTHAHAGNTNRTQWLKIRGPKVGRECGRECLGGIERMSEGEYDQNTVDTCMNYQRTSKNVI